MELLTRILFFSRTIIIISMSFIVPQQTNNVNAFIFGSSKLLRRLFHHHHHHHHHRQYPPAVFSLYDYHQYQHSSVMSKQHQRKRQLHHTSLYSVNTNENNQERRIENRHFSQKHKNSTKTMKYGLLLSRFTEGVLLPQKEQQVQEQYSSQHPKFKNNISQNPTSKLFFQYSLASILTMEYISLVQKEIESSVKYSPCAGPNIDYLNLLKDGDDILERMDDYIAFTFGGLYNGNSGSNNSNYHHDYNSTMSSNILHKRKNHQSKNVVDDEEKKDNIEIQIDQHETITLHEVLSYFNLVKTTLAASYHEPTIKIVYIPTALYALRKDSTNTPGKQRQRARADGKQRRDRIVQFIETLFQSNDDDDQVTHTGINSLLNTLVVTLDLDDGSIKQAKSNGPRFEKYNDEELNELFPISGRDSLSSWNPHVIYVEGGNTFWLQHCIDKGDWSDLIVDACTCSSSSSLSTKPALYVGSSAGAIIAGKYVETATWKVRSILRTIFIYKKLYALLYRLTLSNW